MCKPRSTLGLAITAIVNGVNSSISDLLVTPTKPVLLKLGLVLKRESWKKKSGQWILLVFYQRMSGGVDEMCRIQ